MNYEPNTIDWKIGDFVIHDADSKVEFMLMKVIKISVDLKSNEVIYFTEYVYPHLIENGIYENDKKFLHDPAKFNIKIPIGESK
jgi:hypothetical protein